MVVLNFYEETKNIETITRYNGGWLKTVKGLDKTKNNGYSIIGDFVKAGDYKQNYAEGLYIDCSKGGSRKNQEFNYHLFRVSEKGFELLMTLEDANRCWAVDFWDAIEENLNKSEEITAQNIVNQILEKTGNNKELLKEVIELFKHASNEKTYRFKGEDATLDEIKTYLKLNHIYEFKAEIREQDIVKARKHLAQHNNCSEEDIKKLEHKEAFKIATLFTRLGFSFKTELVKYEDFNNNIDKFKFGTYLVFSDRIKVFCNNYSEISYTEIRLF